MKGKKVYRVTRKIGDKWITINSIFTSKQRAATEAKNQRERGFKAKFYSQKASSAYKDKKQQERNDRQRFGR